MASPSNAQAVKPGPNHTASARCPACAHRGSAVIVSTSNASVGNLFLMLALCITCACCLLGDTRDPNLVCYCERCGLRLITEDNEGSQVQYSDKYLIPMPSSAKEKIDAHLKSGLKAARSPLGLPPPMNRANLVNINARYRDMTPVRKLVVETGRFSLPSKASDSAQPAMLAYLIESPGIPPAEPADKKEQQYLQRRCAWNYGSGLAHLTPHFRVSSLDQSGFSQELARVKLFGGTDWDAEIHVADREPVQNSAGTKPGNLGGKLAFTKRHMLAKEESDWRTSGPGVLWASSEGLVLWSMRTVKDAEKLNVRALCLLDAYDRLVVAVHKTRLPEGKGKVWEMRVYAQLSDIFMGEILASYTALRCQQERIAQEHIYDSS